MHRLIFTKEDAANALEKIRLGRRLIEKEENWLQKQFMAPKLLTQYKTAKDAYMASNKFCAVGAIERACYELDGDISNYMIARAGLMHGLPKTWTVTIVDYNDARTHRSVLKMFDTAIKDMEQIMKDGTSRFDT